MNIILLSGGSGKRLWPLSNDIRSKQFIKIFKDKNGKYESMLQNMYRNIRNIDKNAIITIATSKNQVSTIKNQIGEDIGISIEPCRRDTFPAIALATAYLHDVKQVQLDEPVVVCPVDPYVDENYFKALDSLYNLAENSKTNLTLMGIDPTYPSEKYGYIIPENKDKVSKVKMFKEKPTTEVAKQYIEQGALWNGGIFAYKLKYVMDIAHKLIDFEDYNDLYNKYDTVKKISFDYAVVEQEKNIQVMRFCGEWKDLGTWNTLTESMSQNILGKGLLDEKCENTHIVNELNIPVLGMGLKDIVVVSSCDGILVSDKERTGYIKPYVEKIQGQVMFAEKSWGSYKVIDVQQDSMTVLLVVKQKRRMKYHSHECRDEIWTIVSGEGKVIIDGEEKHVKAGDVVEMKAGCKHMLIADTEMKIIEVQIGKDIDENDKKEFKLK